MITLLEVKEPEMMMIKGSTHSRLTISSRMPLIQSNAMVEGDFLIFMRFASLPQNSAYSGFFRLMAKFVTSMTMNPNRLWNRPAAVPMPMESGWVVVMRYT